MREKLLLLTELQRIDLKIDGWNEQRQGLLDQVSELDRRIEESQTAISEKNSELACLQEDKQALEENLALEQENMHRSESRLKEIKTQKEYQAVLKEISTAKKLISELEDQSLQKIGLLDELKVAIGAAEEGLQEFSREIGLQREQLLAEVGRLDSSVADDMTIRTEVIKKLPASVVRRYQMLREQRRGLAVVEAKNGCCMGCNMNLPPQLYNSLFRGDELITCPHCNRMLQLAAQGDT